MTDCVCVYYVATCNDFCVYTSWCHLCTWDVVILLFLWCSKVSLSMDCVFFFGRWLQAHIEVFSLAGIIIMMLTLHYSLHAMPTPYRDK